MLLRSASSIAKSGRILQQSAPSITRDDRLLRSGSGITKCDSYYKMRRNACPAGQVRLRNHDFFMLSSTFI